jgi:hypothetical protein
MHRNHANNISPGWKEKNHAHTHLLKTESGLLKAQQPLCRTRSSASRLQGARPAMSARRGPAGSRGSSGERRAGGRAGGAARGWAGSRCAASGRYFMAWARWPRSCCGERRAAGGGRVGARGLRPGGGGTSVRSASGSLPPSRAPASLELGWTCGSLSLRSDRDWRAIARPRVSHHQNLQK